MKFFSKKTQSAKISSKKKLSLTVAAALCAAAVICPAAVAAAEYFAETDPLVTLSYLVDIFAPNLKEQIKSEISQGAPAQSGYAVVELSKGQKLTSSEGAVELILRPGSSAKVISDIPDNGLSDISDAKEVTNGGEVGINHSLIIPRNDGRGIEITSDKAFVLVRGNYIISDN